MNVGSLHPRVTIALGNRGASRYVREGHVPIDGFDVSFFPEAPRDGRPLFAAPIYTAAVNDPPYDAGEIAFVTYVQAVDRGMQVTGIPVVTSRVFDHLAAFVRTDAGIQSPQDLAGRRFLCGAFSMNPAVRLRGILEHQYGVLIDRITWVENRDEHFLDFSAPARFTVERMEIDETVDDLLASGRLDGFQRGIAQGSAFAGIERLFDDPYKELSAYVAEHEFLPVNSVVMILRSTLERAPGFAEALLKAFVQASDRYHHDVAAGRRELVEDGVDLVRLERETGIGLPDPGLGKNRAAIRMLTQYCAEQGVISRMYEPEELFLFPDS